MKSNLKNIVNRVQNEINVKVKSYSEIMPDASLRRYYRLNLENPFNNSNTIVLMVYPDSLKESEVSSSNLSNIKAFTELLKFFSINNISVPKLYLENKEENFLLLEDLGNNLLADFLLEKTSTRLEEIKNFYKRAIDIIFDLQKISNVSKTLPFKRKFTSDILISEMMEFLDFFIRPLNKEINENVLLSSFKEIGAEIEAMPYTLVHRDYHSWNLMLDKNNDIRVIDFQDALLGPETYDLVALLNDRDTDSLLKKELYRELLFYFFNKHPSSNIENEYYLTLLQRDLKVVGRFNKLYKERGLESYKKWVPGTLKRIGRTLAKITKENKNPVYKDFIKELKKVKEISIGLESLN